MTQATGRLPATMALVVLVLVTIGCSPATTSTTPSTGAGSPVTPVGSASPNPSAPAASPSPTPTPVTTPAATAAPSTACVVAPQTGQLPSDRFINLRVASGATSDRLTFVFGNGSLPGPAGAPEGSLEAAEAPYTEAGSGATIEVIGQRVLQIRFSGMSLSNDAGQETYTGPREIKPDLRTLRHAVIFDASEGVIGWYVGYDGAGCVTLARDGNDVTVTIDHA